MICSKSMLTDRVAGAVFATALASCILAGSSIESDRFSSSRSLAELDYETTGSVATGVFASVAFPFKPNISIRWNEIEKKVSRLDAKDCGDTAACRIRLGILNETLGAVQSLPLDKKITAVNIAVNRLVEYRSDKEIYGTLDYWATPQEVLASGRGDCEDFAIMKMAVLRMAGVPSDSMALVVVRDSSRNFYHAVLAVTTNSNTYVLDNLRSSVLTDKQLPQYQALYSLSTQRAWIHGYKRGSEFAMQKRPTSLEAVRPGEGVPATGEPADQRGIVAPAHGNT